MKSTVLTIINKNKHVTIDMIKHIDNNIDGRR